MQDDIYNQFEVPTFESKVFSISGYDLFNLKMQGDESAFGLKVDGNYSVINQSPSFTLNYGVNPGINILKQAGDSTTATNIMTISVTCAPRALIAVNASCPGVSIKVIFLSLISTS